MKDFYNIEKINYPKVPKQIKRSFRSYLRRAAYHSLVGWKLPPMGKGLKKFVEEEIQPRNNDDIRAWLWSHKTFHHIKAGMQKKMREDNQDWQKKYR
jgi:hypothetical protein